MGCSILERNHPNIQINIFAVLDIIKRRQQTAENIVKKNGKNVKYWQGVVANCKIFRNEIGRLIDDMPL